MIKTMAVILGLEILMVCVVTLISFYKERRDEQKKNVRYYDVYRTNRNDRVTYSDLTKKVELYELVKGKRYD